MIRRRRKNRKKLIAKQRRNACVYKGIAEASVTFCGEEEQHNECEAVFAAGIKNAAIDM